MLIALSGPSGIGKGFATRRLMEACPELTQLPWLTTRSLRPGEHPNGNRIHVSPDHFEEMKRAGQCVLAQELYGNWYGMECARLLPQAVPCLTEIHPAQAGAALAIVPSATLIGLVTEDFGLLRERMNGRGDEHSSIDDRLAAAQSDISLILRQRDRFRLIVSVSREDTGIEAIVGLVRTIMSSKGESHASR